MPKKYQEEYFDDIHMVKRKGGMFLRIISFMFVLCVAFGVIVGADYLGTFIATGQFSSNIFVGKEKEERYYALSLGQFSNREEAEDLAYNCGQEGAAGYVWEDDEVYVLASVYKTKEDAEKVVSKLEGYNGEIVEIKCVKKDDETSKTLNDVFADIYTINTKTDKEQMDKETVSTELGKLKNKIGNLVNKQTGMQSDKTDQIKLILQDLHSSLEDVSLQVLYSNNCSHIIKNLLVKTLIAKVDISKL